MKRDTLSEMLMKYDTLCEILMKYNTLSEIFMKCNTLSEILMEYDTLSEIMMTYDNVFVDHKSIQQTLTEALGLTLAAAEAILPLIKTGITKQQKTFPVSVAPGMKKDIFRLCST